MDQVRVTQVVEYRQELGPEPRFVLSPIGPEAMVLHGIAGSGDPETVMPELPDIFSIMARKIAPTCSRGCRNSA